jgi:osmoprotectant transport system substrate-binding protein
MTRSRWRAAGALVLALVLTITVTACGNDDNSEAKTTTTKIEGPTIRLAPQDVTEDKTLVEVYGQYLKAKGFDVDIQPAVGARKAAYQALEANKLDMIVDYAGSAVTQLDATKTGSTDPAATAATLNQLLSAQGLVAFDYASAEDTNALVTLKSYATEHALVNISDLSKVGSVVLGGAPECATRSDCLLGYQDPAKYGLKMTFHQEGYGPPFVTALQSGEVQVAQYQSTAPEIAAGTIVALKDDKGLFSSDNITPVLRKALADQYGTKLADAVNALSAKLTTADLAGFNKSTDLDKEEPADVAKAWLKDNGLI